MFIDTHMHEMTCSKDSFLKLEQMVEIAREKGLGAICITDHDDMGLKEYAEEYAEKPDFRSLSGFEFFFFCRETSSHLEFEEYPDERIPAQEFIDLVKSQGGFCFAAHPFRNNNRGLEENLRTVRGLDGLEVLNGSTSVAACQKAARYAQKLGLCTMGSSDCHVPEKVGVCATWFPEEIRTMEEFLEALKKGGMKPAYYEDGSYHILEVQEYGNGYPEIGF